MYAQTPFRFDIACDVFEKASPDGRDRRIAGLVSTDELDRQGETIIQEGLDFEPFLKGGWFNDNHDSATDAVVGYPISAELVQLPGRRGWWVEGYLIKGTKRADGIYDLANALQKSDRRLGFSVEGSILARDPNNPKVVSRAIVREVAITRCPVNTGTALAVLAKSLSAGSAIAAPAVAPGEGFPLRGESLEGAPRKKKKLKRSEAIALVRSMNPAVSQGTAERIVDLALLTPAA